MKIFASIHLEHWWREKTPCPHQGELIVWAPGPEPGPPDKGRAVIYSGRREGLGVVGESGGGGPAGARGLRGPDHCAAGGRGACSRRRCPPPPRPERRPQAGLSAFGSGPWLPSSPTPPTASKEKGGAVQRKATPRAGGSVRAPGGSGRRAGEGGGREQRGPAEAAACVVLFLDGFQLWGKKTFVSRYKKSGEVGGRSWGKNCKAQTGTHVCKVD